VLILRCPITTLLRSLRDHEAGSQAIELALTLPVFLVLFFGVIECGRLLFTYAALNFAAEEATRHAAVKWDPTKPTIENVEEIEEFARNRLIAIGLSEISDDDIDVVPEDAGKTMRVSVEIAYTFQPILPIGLGLFTMTGHSRGFHI
jgi:Flp pilus assembly protein TadG